MRQLALRVAKSARRMGYTTSPNTIQPILGGHKNRTRGFVYRAMLKQFPGGREQVPEEHVIAAPWVARASERTARPPAEPKLSRPRAKLSGSDKAASNPDPLAAYLRSARGLLVPSPEAQVEPARRPRPIRRSRPDGAHGDAASMYLEAAGREPLLTKGEEVELAIRIERGRMALATAVRAGSSPAPSAWSRGGSPPPGKTPAAIDPGQPAPGGQRGQEVHRARAPLLDLVEEGNLGLMKAVEKFD